MSLSFSDLASHQNDSETKFYSGFYNGGRRRSCRIKSGRRRRQGRRERGVLNPPPLEQSRRPYPNIHRQI